MRGPREDGAALSLAQDLHRGESNPRGWKRWVLANRPLFHGCTGGAARDTASEAGVARIASRDSQRGSQGALCCKGAAQMGKPVAHPGDHHPQPFCLIDPRVISGGALEPASPELFQSVCGRHGDDCWLGLHSDVDATSRGKARPGSLCDAYPDKVEAGCTVGTPAAPRRPGLSGCGAPSGHNACYVGVQEGPRVDPRRPEEACRPATAHSCVKINRSRCGDLQHSPPCRADNGLHRADSLGRA